MGSFIVRTYCLKYEQGLSGVILSGTAHFDAPLLATALSIANLQCLLGGEKKPSHLLNNMAKNEGKLGKKVVYTSDPMRQAASIALYENKGIDVIVLDALIDLNFVSFIEYSAGIEGLSFARVDADAATFTQEEPAADEDAKKALEADQEKLKALFKDATGSDTLQIKLQTLTDADTSALLTQDEQGRRYSDMSKIYGQDFKLPEQHTLVLNRANTVVQALLTEEDGEKRKLIAAQLYDLARMRTISG